MAAPGTVNRARQDKELDLLVSMYPTECKRHHSNTSGEGDLRCLLEIQPSYTLEISLPDQYPETAPPATYLQCGDLVSTADRKAARGKLVEITASSWGEQQGECLDVLVEAFGEWLRQLGRSRSANVDDQDGSSAPSTDENPAEAVVDKSSQVDDTANREQDSHATKISDHPIKRVLLWSHHLLATSKRKDIIAWSRELHLGGFSRPGYPGAIFVEGDSDCVSEFVARVKGLRWQALQLRVDQGAGCRVLGHGDDGVEEVESLGEVVERLKGLEGGLVEMFLEGMKIGR